ncbi:hypothetical protein ACHHYP_02715 [Achlya hypogyna]|uniref:Uncharacterized protein n=1 Tax=Achlya hypogyna TaxID=1202772 RepID=A0A1V9ZRY7_ACHHY|nr:hypothetical protein ACHHYP_02715 [Achlya hypogyna]
MGVVYEVTNYCDEAAVPVLLAYMAGGHLQDMLDTGCFAAAEFEQCAPTTFRSRYLAESQADIDRYLANHAAAMRDDFQKHLPTGVRCERALFTQIWFCLLATMSHTIHFPRSKPQQTLLVESRHGDNVIGGVLAHIPGRVFISFEPANETLATVRTYGSVHGGRGRHLKVDTLPMSKGLKALTLAPYGSWPSAATSLVHVVLHQPHSLRYLSTTADTAFFPSTYDSVLPEDAASRASHLQLIARGTGNLLVHQVSSLDMASLIVENYGAGTVQVHVGGHLDLATSLELQAVGSGPIAIATPSLHTGLLRASASQGSVFVEAHDLSSPFVRSTMSGNGTINYNPTHGICSTHDASMLGNGTIHASALECNRTTVFAPGPGTVIADSGVAVQTTHAGPDSDPLEVTHIGAPRAVVASSPKWQLVPLPPFAPLEVGGAAPLQALAATAPIAMTSAVEAVLLLALAIAVPMAVWTYYKRRAYTPLQP